MGLWLFLMALALPAHAYETCDTALMERRESLQAIGFLQSIAGFYDGDTCQLSIDVCSGFMTAPGSKGREMVGEVLLVDKRSGREAYLPLVFQDTPTVRTRFAIENGRRLFHYEFADRNPVSGQTGLQVSLFEVVKTADLSRLEYVEFGQREPGQSRLQWFVCRLKERVSKN